MERTTIYVVTISSLLRLTKVNRHPLTCVVYDDQIFESMKDYVQGKDIVEHWLRMSCNRAEQDCFSHVELEKLFREDARIATCYCRVLRQS